MLVGEGEDKREFVQISFTIFLDSMMNEIIMIKLLLNICDNFQEENYIYSIP